MAKTWFSRLFSRSSRRTAARRAKQNKFTKSFLAIDRLEDRTVPATYTYDPANLRLTITMDGTENGLTAGIQGLNLYVYEQTPAQNGTTTAILKDTRSIVGAAAVTNISLVGSSGNDVVFFTPGSPSATPPTSNVYGNGASQHTLNPVPFLTTLNGMAGDDSIVGGNGADQLIGNLGNDTLSGANGTDTVIEAMAAPGTFSISNNLGVGGPGSGLVATGGAGTGIDVYPNDTTTLLPTIERASLIGSSGDDVFNIGATSPTNTGWSGSIVLQGGPDTTVANGNDTVVASNDTSMFLTNTALVRLIAGTANLLSIERADLSATNAAASHTFTVSGWTGPELTPGTSPVTLTGASANDQVSVSADADFKLTDSRLERLIGSTLTTSFQLNNIGKALLSGGASDNTFTIGTASGQWTKNATVNGGGGNDTLNYAAETTANFTLNGAGSGTGTQAGVLNSGGKLDSFQNIETLVGNGTSTLTGQNTTNTWTISGANVGSVQPASGAATAFSGMNSLRGGSGNDAFGFKTGGTVGGTIDGQGGTDTLDYSGFGTNPAAVELKSNTSLATPFTSTSAVTISFSGTATGILGGGNAGFVGFEGVVGNDAGATKNTTFTGLAGNSGGTGTPATIGGSGGAVNFFTGGTGIQGARGNATGTWNITGVNTGTVTYGSIITQGSSNATNVAVGNGLFSFANVANITGGAAGSNTTVPLAETFKMGAAGALSGAINGGTLGAGADNTLDYSAVTGPITVNINTANAPNLNGSTGSGFTNISSLVGTAASDTLIGRNLNNVWTVGASGNNSGVVNNNTIGIGVPLAFSSFENLTGGTADDVFQMLNNNSLSGAISDQGGSTYGIQYDPSFSNPITVGLNDDGGTTTATGVGLGMLQTGNRVNLVIGNFNPASTLVGRNANATWFLSAADGSGTILYTGGASAGDAINFFSMANLTGGLATDNLDASGLIGPVTLNLSVGTANGIGISGFEALKGNDAPKSDLVGGTGTPPTTRNTTVIGPAATVNWTISGPNSGQMSFGSGPQVIPFTQIGNVTGGAGNDNFLFTTTPPTAPGALSGKLDGGGGNDALDLSGYTAPIIVNLGGQTQVIGTGAIIIGGSGSPTTPAIQNLETITGGQSTGDVLQGSNTTTLWVIDGVNTGTVNGARFTAFEQLKGGTGNDTYSILNGGSLSLSSDPSGSDTLSYQSYTGTVLVDLQAGTAPGVTAGTFALIENFIGNDGTTGANSTLKGKDESAIWTVNNTNAGTYVSSSFPLSNFAGFGNITGGSLSDLFNVTTDTTNKTSGALTGKLDAAGGQDTLSYNGYAPNTTGANPIALTLTSLTVSSTPLSATGTGTGLTGGFNSIENLVGNDPTASTANATLSSFGAANWTWNVTGVNSGNVTNDTVSAGNLPFSQIGNLSGGAGNDTYIITTGTLSGTVAGNGGTNVLDYSGVPSSTLISITLTGTGSGTSNAVGGFSSMQSIKGNGNTLLTGLNAGSTWNINGPNSGTVDGLPAGFTGVSSVTGGTGSDTFNINTGGSLSGFLSGGGGANVLSYAANASNVDINLNTFVATSLGGFDPATIAVIVGNGDNTALHGRDANGVWTITAQNTGNVTFDTAPANFSFSGVGFLAGGSGNDAFTINPGASLTVALDGGGFGANPPGNSLTISVPTNVTISDSLLITGGTTTTSIANFQNATLIGTGSNTLYDVSGWTQNLNILAGGGTNTLVASGDTNYTLTNSKLTRSFPGTVNFSNIQRAILSGGSGDNQFDISDWTTGTNRVTCNGGSGNDRIVAQASTSDAATINLNNSSLTRSGLAPATLVSIEQAVIVGGAGANNINAASFGGSAVLIGGAGNDTVVGGVGNDTVFGGSGDDNVNGGGGNDIVAGGTGSDTVNGGAGNDRITGDKFDNATYYQESLTTLNTAFQVPLFFNSPLSLQTDSQFVLQLTNDTLDQVLGGGGTDTAYVRQNNPDGDRNSLGASFAVPLLGSNGASGDITVVWGY